MQDYHEPKVGDPAPDFRLPSTRGKAVTLKEFRGKDVILYFYPKDDTPGCTKEACSFTDHLPRFKSSQAAVLGVSILDEKSKARFADKYKIGFPLLADPDHEVAEKYGTWQKKSRYGRSYMGIVRTTFLIDSSGKVARRWDNVKVDGHTDEVLKAAEELRS
jgi:peroxiredoxin Q/BCP